MRASRALPALLVAASLAPHLPAPAASDRAAAAAAVNATARFPGGDEGRLIAYGHDLITKTPALLGPYIRAGMSCEACHLNAGRKPHAGSLLGIYVQFPQFNRRSHRYITLGDRLAECFLYSMNGKPPAYDSREMVALTAYIAFLSRGATVPAGFSGQRLVPIQPVRAPSPSAGKRIYTRMCSACHAADGSGNNGAFPPLWGLKSFNAGAGMHRLATMASFVRYNMPYGGPPNVLTPQEAYDVSAYVLAHPRPRFDATQPIAFPARPAGYY